MKRKVALLKHISASNTLHSAKFHCFASHYSAYFGGCSLSNTRKVSITNTNTAPSYLHRTQTYAIIHELMCTDCAQIHTSHLFLFQLKFPRKHSQGSPQNYLSKCEMPEAAVYGLSFFPKPWRPPTRRNCTIGTTGINVALP